MTVIKYFTFIVQKTGFKKYIESVKSGGRFNFSYSFAYFMKNKTKIPKA